MIFSTRKMPFYSGLAYACSAFLCLLGIDSRVHAKVEPMLDETAMNRDADPCIDFQEYACGTWNKTTEIPADKPSWYRSFSSITEENLKTNRELLENFAAGRNLEFSKNSRKLGSFYAACTNTDAILAQAKATLASEFSQIENTTMANLASKVGEFKNKGVSLFFKFHSEQDLENSSKIIAVIDQGGMGLPSRDYYFDEDKAPIREKYLTHVAKMLELAGVSSEQAQYGAHSILTFETRIAEKALRPVERRDAARLYHIHTLPQLKAMMPQFNWDHYFEAAGSPRFETLNIAVPDFFTHLNLILSETTLNQIRLYMRWKLISSLASDLGGEFSKEHFEFYGKALSGQKEMMPRWKYCTDSADENLADALGEAFVAKTFGEEGKAKTLSILDSVRNVFKRTLNTLEWMDESTRTFAVKKLDTFIQKIGFPDEWTDISTIEIAEQHIPNVFSTRRFSVNKDLAKIGKAVNRKEWDMTPPTVNAYYNPQNNEIVFPAGILQSPMFNLSAPLAANFGAFGSVVGHEMTHGFDDEGRQFDQNGNLKDWWTPAAGKLFEEKSQCLIDQYSKYTVADGVHLDGKLTLGENIADLGGVKMAYAALQDTLPRDLSESDKIAEDQKFFISFAQVWCSKSTLEYQKLAATTDPHSPPKYRINGVLANLPEFAHAFGCKAGTPMAPISRCSIW